MELIIALLEVLLFLKLNALMRQRSYGPQLPQLQHLITLLSQEVVLWQSITIDCSGIIILKELIQTITLFVEIIL
jgi:hypothetical protein